MLRAIDYLLFTTACALYAYLGAHQIQLALSPVLDHVCNLMAH